MVAHRRSLRILPSALVALLVFAGSCVDAPSAPDDGFLPGPLVFAPNLSLVGPSGAPAATQAQADALSEAFDLVDRFHMVVHRATNNAVVVDTVILVTPGQESYDLSASVTISSADEQFLVSFTALQGATELFSSPPMAVKATPEGSTGSTPPTPINITLTYSGPGATATAVELEPAVVVVGPGGTATFAATVLDAEGNALSDVPISWTAGSEAVATVAGGEVTGQADGITSIVVATPTGLAATAAAYVVSGNLAYVEDGQVKVRAAGGGDAEERSSGSGASAPAWTADGGLLYYATGGSVVLAGTSAAIVQGDWPAVSPSGTYLAVDQGGQVVFANADGSMERAGPSGTTPVWADDGTLIVGGGSIEQVDVSGSGRSTLVPGDAQLPALGPAGAVAYLSGGELMVTGRDASLASGAFGRPSWSDGGTWLAFGGADGIMVVPADGSAPAAPLPGLATASDAAWQPSSPLAAPSAPSLTGLNPDPPIPGQPVDILGSGFDRVIPANNHVFWPTPDGSEESEVSAVGAGSLTTVMPRRVAVGQIRVENRAGTAVLDFVPSLGALEVTAMTRWDTGVPGVLVMILSGASTELARGETDADGLLLLSGLQPGNYTVQITPPTDYVFQGSTSRTVEIGTDTQLLELVLSPLIATVVSDPEAPVVAVGELINVGITAYDAAGNIIPEFESSRWGPVTTHMGVGGGGLSGGLSGAWPTAERGGAEYSVTLNGQVFILHATVVSSIHGTITRATEGGSEPAQSRGVSLEKGDVEVAKTETDGSGRYVFDGVLGGEYTVKPAVSDEERATPTSKVVTLNNTGPIGKADFVIKPKGAAADGDIVVVNDWNIWDSSANGPTLVQNLVETAPNDGTKVVWWCGRQANPFKICAASINADGSGQFQGTRDHITAAGWDFEVDYQTPLVSIPDDVRVFWLWTPTETLTDAEVNVLKEFAARGGRIVFNSDFKESWYTAAQHANIETALLTQLGTGITSTGTMQGSTGVIVAPDHPIMAGVTSVSFGSPGDMQVSAPAVALVTDSGGDVLMAWAPVISTPLTKSSFTLVAPSKILSSTPTIPVAVESRTDCVPGTVCREEPSESSENEQDSTRPFDKPRPE